MTTRASLLRQLVRPKTGTAQHVWSPPRESILRGVAGALGDQLVSLLYDGGHAFDRDDVYAKVAKDAPKFVAAVERRNGMVIEDLYVTAIDRPGKFTYNRRGPYAFGHVMTDESFRGPVGLAEMPLWVWKSGAPAFPHRLPNARWERSDRSTPYNLVTTYALVLEGTQHLS